eukprot:4973665-Pyramimonas_sp.AAC.1
MVSTGIKTDGGISIVSDRHHMHGKLIEHWAPIFTAKPINRDLAADYLQLYLRPLDFDSAPPPAPKLPEDIAKRFR